LLTQLYGGLLQEAPWQAFLQSLAAHIDAENAILILLAPESEVPRSPTRVFRPSASRLTKTSAWATPSASLTRTSSTASRSSETLPPGPSRPLKKLGR